MRIQPLIARLLLVIPVIGLGVHQRYSNMVLLVIYGILWLWLFFQDQGVAKTHPNMISPSNQILRAGIFFSLLLWPLHYVLGDPPLSEVVWTGTGVAIILGPFVSGLCLVARGLTYWASLPWPWNSDCIAVRRGGRIEPNTDFSPPSEWRFQCPQCGARVETKQCICWNCGYGSQSPNQAYIPDEPDEPDSPSTPIGPYGPIDPNRP